LIIDEADAIAPQRPYKGEERMLGAAEDLVRRGGQRGIGVTMATQRAAVLNKNVLTQIGMLVLLRTIAPQDIDAVDSWVELHGTKTQRDRLMESLPSLPIGDAWFWAPGWPDEDGIFKRIHVELPETFDSFATPKAGERRVLPKNAADVDLEAFRREMASTIEKAKAEDPRELRKEIAGLRKQLTEAQREKPAAPAKEKVVEKPIVSDKQLGTLNAAVERLCALEQRFMDRFDVVKNEVIGIRDELARAAKVGNLPTPQRPVQQPGRTPSPPVHMRADARIATSIRSQKPADVESNGDLSKGEQTILTAVAQYSDVGVDHDQLAVLTGYKKTSRQEYLRRLYQRGYVELRNGRICATGGGVTALGDFEPLPVGDALRDYWLARLSGGEKTILEVLCGAYPNGMEYAELEAATGYKKTSRQEYVRRLIARRLVITAGGAARASEELFG
jgi:uncharacterized protein